MEMDRGKDLHRDLGKHKRDDEGTSVGEDAISVDGSCCPPLLPKHKIFLSHSGKQKWFVEKLCDGLEARHRFPFFDKRPSSLPKGERFPKLIQEAAERCEMAVVVLSEEFLTSKWPMIELSTFVRAMSGCNPGLKILPLFFAMTVSELGSPSRQAAWLEVWEKWERDDPRMKVADLEKALKVMRSFNGMEFNGDMNNVWSYEKDVVKAICSVVGADVKWEDSHVQGRSGICEATREKMKEIEGSENGIRMFGYYGVGGIGKTTMCKTLCNELSNEFLGKVCHVELGGTQSVEQMLKEMLRKLTITSEEVLHGLDEDECRSILKNRSSWRQRTFLAIDNVWEDNKSLAQAEMLLQDPSFYEGSVVMVTSRCQSTLMRVGIEESHCFEVPELGEEDARKLFVHHVVGGKQLDYDGYTVAIDKCIARCRFRKSETQGYHYLPLALKVLGVHLRRCGRSPSKWLEYLPEVRDFNRFEGDNPVFSIIRLNYDRLSVQLQALFMDVAIFWKVPTGWWWQLGYLDGYFSELSLVNRQKLQDTESQLQQLKERGLLEEVDMESRGVNMHDLYKEFARMEAEGKLNSFKGLNNRKWVLYTGSHLSNFERTPSGGCWENLIRMHLDIMGDDGDVLSLEGIQWRYFSNLVVLRIELSRKSKGVLNLEGLRCLRSLVVYSHRIFDGVDGLKDLKNLTYFEWNGMGMPMNSRLTSFRQFPSSLKILRLSLVDVCFGREVFDRCLHLLELSLERLGASGRIDLRQCTSLRSLHLQTIRGLRTLLVPSKMRSSLQFLRIMDCVDLSGVWDCRSWETCRHWVICHQWLTCQDVVIRGLGSLEQLHEISLSNLDVLELPNLNALKHLRSLALERCKKLTHLEGVEGLTALRRVYLNECWSLSRLPDLRNSTELETLYLSNSGIELHEEDIDMLAALPGLRVVQIGRTSHAYSSWQCSIMLDPVRRKVVISKDYGSVILEERDLETLPIQLRSYEYSRRN